MGFKANGSLLCDNFCGSLIDLALPEDDWGPVPQVEVINRARAKGWHCYRGPNLPGTVVLESYICDRCMKSPRQKLDPIMLLEGQEPLFPEEGL